MLYLVSGTSHTFNNTVYQHNINSLFCLCRERKLGLETMNKALAEYKKLSECKNRELSINDLKEWIAKCEKETILRPPTSMVTWSSSDVIQWIKSLGFAFDPYCESFRFNGVTGQSLIRCDSEALKSLGVDHAYHRTRMMLDITNEQSPKTL